MGDQDYFGYYESPIGWIEIISTETEIISLQFVEGPRQRTIASYCLKQAMEQVSEYFLGIRKVFNLRLGFYGTAFQRQVWEHLMTIPFGQTTTYQKIALVIKRPQAVRAVGAANGRNPISLIVPCHRVIGSDGSLTGYGGGIWRKEWLLRHESFWDL
jgi:methylated-DNA-[protein]-cysteine S-methyltransferase